MRRYESKKRAPSAFARAILDEYTVPLHVWFKGMVQKRRGSSPPLNLFSGK